MAHDTRIGAQLSSMSAINQLRDVGVSISDCLFLLQVARKQGADAALETAMKQMTEKLDLGKALQQFSESFGNRAVDNGKIVLNNLDIALLKKAGFNVDATGELITVRAQGAPASAFLLMADDGRVYVPATQLDAFKTALNGHIGSLSSSNEIEMMQLQRLMNSANEATQAASAQLKSSHEISMAIIRNIA